MPGNVGDILEYIPVSEGGLSNMPGIAAGVSDFIVPPGYPNDTFIARFTSGERLNVETPAQQRAGGGEIDYNALANAVATALVGVLPTAQENARAYADALSEFIE